jgi:hypothetical protein
VGAVGKGVIEFNAVIESADRGGAFVVVPPEVVERLGGGGRIPVRVELEGIPYQGSIATYSGRQVLGILKATRDELGRGPGDEVAVRIEVDTSERTVEIPSELDRLFSKVPGSREAFLKLSYSHQREHVEHINEAKKEETRLRRARRTIDAVRGR